MQCRWRFIRCRHLRLGEGGSSRAAFLSERGKSTLWRHLTAPLRCPRHSRFVSFHLFRFIRICVSPYVPSGEVQYDIELVHNIERYTGTPLGLCPEVVEEDVLKLLNQVAKASRVAKMRLMEQVKRW